MLFQSATSSARIGGVARLLDGEGLRQAVERLRVAVLVAVQASQAVQNGRGIAGSEGESAGEERLRLPVASLGPQVLGEIPESVARLLRLGGLEALERLDGSAQERLRVLEAVEAIETEGEVLSNACDIDVALALLRDPQGEDAPVEVRAAGPVARVVREGGQLLERRDQREVVSADRLLAQRESSPEQLPPEGGGLGLRELEGACSEALQGVREPEGIGLPARRQGLRLGTQRRDRRGRGGRRLLG